MMSGFWSEAGDMVQDRQVVGLQEAAEARHRYQYDASVNMLFRLGSQAWGRRALMEAFT